MGWVTWTELASDHGLRMARVGRVPMSWVQTDLRRGRDSSKMHFVREVPQVRAQTCAPPECG